MLHFWFSGQEGQEENERIGECLLSLRLFENTIKVKVTVRLVVRLLTIFTLSQGHLGFLLLTWCIKNPSSTSVRPTRLKYDKIDHLIDHMQLLQVELFKCVKCDPLTQCTWVKLSVTAWYWWLECTFGEPPDEVQCRISALTRISPVPRRYSSRGGGDGERKAVSLCSMKCRTTRRPRLNS